jgi:hypothetical protein
LETGNLRHLSGSVAHPATTKGVETAPPEVGVSIEATLPSGIVTRTVFTRSKAPPAVLRA